MEKAIPEEIKEVDLLVGIPSYNHARTIKQVAQTVSAGLGKFFPEAGWILCISDGGSTDGTPEQVKKAQIEDARLIFTSHPVHPIDKIYPPYRGILGQEKAFRTFLENAKSLKAKACCVVDPDVKSITPEWMKNLLQPIYTDGFDYVAPLFARPKFDGTITNSIVYPLTRALYGRRVQQPIGGNFSFSGKLAAFYLEKAVWEDDAVRLGLDIWASTLALSGKFKVGQAHLGVKIHEAREKTSDLATMFTQVTSSVYALMGEYQDFWKGEKGSQAIPTFGDPQGMAEEPPSVNWERMVRIFRLGAKDLMEVWRKALPNESALWLASIGRLSDGAFHFPPDLWVRLIYDFAVAYRKGSVHRDHLLKSMIPIYLGWVSCFIKENQEASAQEVEERIESLCRVFEEMKPYLREHWP
ncbi:MAG: glycosyl transferase family 2 [Deltaproteobacteria bacterium]|nr:glycosyl transferase family 2 [Deltaproteobacteria bacterium]